MSTETEGNGVLLVAETFAWQSYHDSTALQRGVARQPPGEATVSSTLKSSQVSGYGFTLAPWAEAPVAILPTFGGRAAQGGGPIVIVPGETIRFASRFDGFKWGLPTGWLGGGDVALYVHQGRLSEVKFSNTLHDILFHRMRLQVISAVGVDIGANLAPNWPLKFPSKGTIRYDAAAASDVDQQGRPFLKVQPTRTVLRLRANLLAGPASMRVALYGSEAFDLTSAAAIDLTSVSYEDYVWPITNVWGIGAGQQYPVITLKSGILVDLGTENVTDGGVVFVDDAANGANTIEDLFVDVLRYGRL